MQCPFCESRCTPEQVRFVAADTLLGDPVLGPEAPLRFRTVRFTPEGDAIAPDGTTSNTPACPHCRAAWHPFLRSDPTPEAIDVGPGGIDAAAVVPGDNWRIECDRLPPSPDPEAPEAAIVNCLRGDCLLSFLLTTRPGSPHRLRQTLMGVPLS